MIKSKKEESSLAGYPLNEHPLFFDLPPETRFFMNSVDSVIDYRGDIPFPTRPSTIRNKLLKSPVIQRAFGSPHVEPVHLWEEVLERKVIRPLAPDPDKPQGRGPVTYLIGRDHLRAFALLCHQVAMHDTLFGYSDEKLPEVVLQTRDAAKTIPRLASLLHYPQVVQKPVIVEHKLVPEKKPKSERVVSSQKEQDEDDEAGRIFGGIGGIPFVDISSVNESRKWTALEIAAFRKAIPNWLDEVSYLKTPLDPDSVRMIMFIDAVGHNRRKTFDPKLDGLTFRELYNALTFIRSQLLRSKDGTTVATLFELAKKKRIEDVPKERVIFGGKKK